MDRFLQIINDPSGLAARRRRPRLSQRALAVARRNAESARTLDFMRRYFPLGYEWRRRRRISARMNNARARGNYHLTRAGEARMLRNLNILNNNPLRVAAYQPIIDREIALGENAMMNSEDVRYWDRRVI